MPSRSTSHDRLVRPAPLAGRPYAVLGFGLIVAAAFLVRLRLLTSGAGLASSDGYDDGVYYSAADALVHGRLPYRDFLLLHPPGIVLALAPFALIGSWTADHVGVGLARLAFIAVGSANVALVMLLARRHSRDAAAVAGVLAAVWFPLAYGERSTLLEPLGNLLVLGAALLLDRSRRATASAAAGALAGAAVAVKVWYAVPVLVMLAVVQRRRGAFAAGAVGGGAAVALPFLLAAPSTMLREVVLDQLGRPRSDGGGIGHRLVQILADPLASSPAAGSPQAGVIAALIGAVVVVATAAAWRFPWTRPHVALATLATAVLLASPSFFLHYAAFPAPWIAVVTGVGAAALLQRAPGRLVAVNLLALVCVAVCALNAPALLQTRARPQPVRQLRPLLAAQRGCVVSDDPGLLADADVLSRDLAAGCPLWPDVTGWTYDRDAHRDGSGAPVARAADPAWQRHVLGYLLSGDAVVLARSSTGLSDASRSRIAALPVLGRAGGLVVHRVGAVHDGVRSR